MAKVKAYDITKYEVDPLLNSISHRVAHFLDWGATKYPNVLYQPNVVFQAIMGFKRPPKSNSPEAKSVKNSLFRAQKHLMEIYGRGLVCETNVGYRATMDSEDAINNTVKKKAVRFNSARVRLSEAMELVDVKDLPATTSGKAAKDYFLTLKDATKSLFSEDFERRLLPPSMYEDQN